jgi:hypothetical protein
MFLSSILRLSTLLCHFLVGVGVPGVPRILTLSEVPLVGNIPFRTGVSSFSGVTAIASVSSVAGVPAVAVIPALANIYTCYNNGLSVRLSDSLEKLYLAIGYRIRCPSFAYIDIGYRTYMKTIGWPPLCISLYYYFDDKPL